MERAEAGNDSGAAVDLPMAELSARFPELKNVLERWLAEPNAWAGLDQIKIEHGQPVDSARP